MRSRLNRRHRLRRRDLLKTDGIVGPQLGRDGKIGGDHMCDPGVSADGLAIPKKENRLTILRDLHCSRHNRF